MAANKNKEMAIARSMLRFVNLWKNKPAKFTLEAISKEAPAAMLMQLPSSGIIKRYIDGSFLGEWSFAVCLRIHKPDTYDKLEVLDLFEDFSAYLESGSLPSLPEGSEAVKFELLNTPSLSAAYDDDTEDYQANYRLIYRGQ